MFPQQCVVKDNPFPASPCLLHPQNTISSDVQYKPQTLPSKHPIMTSLRKRENYKQRLNLRLTPLHPTLP